MSAALAHTALFSVLSVALLTGCDNSAGKSPAKPVAMQPLNPALSKTFSADQAYRHVAAIAGIVPRSVGTPGHAATLDYLEENLKELGWNTLRQSFRAATPDGPVEFTNLLARHISAPGLPESLPIVIAGHYDAKRFSFPFASANDGASSSGIMLELARVLATDPASAARVEFAFFDGEESLHHSITRTDGLYGSKFYASALRERRSRPALAVVLDLVGDPSKALLWNPEAPPSFSKIVAAEAAKLNFPAPVHQSPDPIIDDHVPLQEAGLPCLHLIGDFLSMPYWHTADDTMAHIRPEMLGRVGELTLRFLASLTAVD